VQAIGVMVSYWSWYVTRADDSDDKVGLHAAELGADDSDDNSVVVMLRNSEQMTAMITKWSSCCVTRSR
jgi:hypothetical protein